MSELGVFPIQPSFDFQLDSEGRMPTSWLVPGHRYTLHARNPHTLPVQFEWHGQKVLDMPVLWMELGEYLRRIHQK